MPDYRNWVQFPFTQLQTSNVLTSLTWSDANISAQIGTDGIPSSLEFMSVEMNQQSIPCGWDITEKVPPKAEVRNKVKEKSWRHLTCVGYVLEPRLHSTPVNLSDLKTRMAGGRIWVLKLDRRDQIWLVHVYLEISINWHMNPKSIGQGCVCLALPVGILLVRMSILES